MATMMKILVTMAIGLCASHMVQCIDQGQRESELGLGSFGRRFLLKHMIDRLPAESIDVIFQKMAEREQAPEMIRTPEKKFSLNRPIASRAAGFSFGTRILPKHSEGQGNYIEPMRYG